MSVQHDPTPLAKCHVAANASAPLVTEWPASEKSHLETLLQGQAVAVEYSGCELRLVDACRLPGKYTWQRTTLSTDTVEINDADELYAKLPLGALSLEGELKRSGRLAVRTTVSGQLRLGEIDTSGVSREGACGRATHVITALSVGAFKLLGGGGTSAKGAGSYAGIGSGGGSTSREEQVVREAGDPNACSASTAEAANPSCASPIQIFLAPIERKKTEEELKAAEEEKVAQTNGGVRIAFASPEDGRPWSLRSHDDQLLCSLPCTRWVAPKSGMYVRRDDAISSGFTSYEVPNSFDVGAGASLDAHVQPPRGSTLGAVGGMAASVGVVMLGGMFFVNNRQVCFNQAHQQQAVKTDCSDPYPIDGGHYYPVWLGPSLMAVGVAGLAASFYWFTWSHGSRLEVTEPGKASAQGSQRRVLLGPGGAAGTF